MGNRQQHSKRVSEFAVRAGLRTANLRRLVCSRVDIERAHAWIPAQSTKGGRAIGIALSDNALPSKNTCSSMKADREQRL
jgi:hypothetical protein